MKILILKPSSLGDVIHAVPVLRLLKLHLPQSQIYWWLDSGLTSLLQDDPDLAGVIPFCRKRWNNPRQWPESLARIRTLRAMRFDCAIDLQGLARSAVFGWLADSGVFYGLDNPREGEREGARSLYDLFPPRSPRGTHAVDRYLSILPLMGVPVHWNFEWLPQRPQVSAAVQRKWNPGSGPWMMLLPGARWDNKRWPVTYFAEVVRRLGQTTHLRFAILGSAADKPLGRAIAEANPKQCLDLTGQTSFHEMIEWIRLGRLTLSNDTGPMHVAAALGKPVITVFGPTDPRSTGPYRQPHNVLQTASLPCVPCLRDVCRYRESLACLHAITPAMVCEKVLRELEKPQSVCMQSCPSGGL